MVAVIQLLSIFGEWTERPSAEEALRDWIKLEEEFKEEMLVEEKLQELTIETDKKDKRKRRKRKKKC